MLIRIAALATPASAASAQGTPPTWTLFADRDATLYESPAGGLANGAGAGLFAGLTGQPRPRVPREACLAALARGLEPSPPRAGSSPPPSRTHPPRATPPREMTGATARDDLTSFFDDDGQKIMPWPETWILANPAAELTATTDLPDPGRYLHFASNDPNP